MVNNARMGMETIHQIRVLAWRPAIAVTIPRKIAKII
jgi:hypothetical protein